MNKEKFAKAVGATHVGHVQMQAGYFGALASVVKPRQLILAPLRCAARLKSANRPCSRLAKIEKGGKHWCWQHA